MVEQSVRNLAHLQDSASTARVLNLLRAHRRYGQDPDYIAHPFFQDAVLNKSMILKHRLRPHELELFSDRRSTATKLILPIDGEDLKLGGRSVLIGQHQYDLIMESVFGEKWRANDVDRRTLEILDELPTLDPFLLREHMKRFDRNPARAYFEISDADVQRMFRFVEHDVSGLIDLCFPPSSGIPVTAEQGSRLVKMILWNSGGPESEPLRMTLRLDPQEYREGVFCWKGFLYYKWTLAESLPVVQDVAQAISEARPRGQIDSETKAYIEKERPALRRAILVVCEHAKRTLKVYDQAYGELLSGQPTPFRDFLLGAPAMFSDIGERLGAVNHIVSFWNFRFPKGRPPLVTPDELTDIFTDFEGSLTFPEINRQAAA